MPEPAVSIAARSALLASGDARPADGSDRSHSFDGNIDWMLIALGICIAGAAYPILLGVAGTVILVFEFSVQMLAGAVNGSSAWKFNVEIVNLIGFSIVAGAAGALWAGIVSLFVMPVYCLFVRSLQLRSNAVWLGATCGGLIGFVSVCPVAPTLPYMYVSTGPFGFLGLLVAIAAGPCLTTILGQIGGAWGGWRSNCEQLHPTPDNQPESIANWTAGEMADSVRQSPFQFRIHHLLWITFWLALLLTAIRLTGLPFEFVLPVLAAWLVYQAVTIYLGRLARIIHEC
jgi:hypothetical protein